MEEGNEYSMTVEAGEVIKEIQVNVKFISVSQILENTNEKVHINIETKESTKYCVELTPKGFRIVGEQFDISNRQENQSRYFETIYALLDSVSTGYRNTFMDALTEKLKGLQDSMEDT